ncbi:MAG TPA: hypothetical protein VHH36_02490 [Candidatus Thermoplasmatota archaeon]|nr:hypothetical protein [Candidatus Thermoplasmatota archaeon]
MRSALLAPILLALLAPAASAALAEVVPPPAEVFADPQEYLGIDVVVRNLASEPLVLDWEVEADEGGGFGVVQPERSHVHVGQSAVVTIRVGAPAHNGYVSDARVVELRAIVRPLSDRSAEPETHVVAFTVRTSGFHVPDPAPLALLAVAAVALATRRRV